MRRTLTAAILISSVVIPAPVAAQAGAPPPAVGQPAKLTFTLLTGDRVTATKEGRVLGVEAGPGRDGMTFRQFTAGGHHYVVPADALAQLDTRLDRDLFDVTALAEYGYDDARRADLPLFVSGGAGGGLAVTRELPAAGLRAVKAPKKDATRTWAGLRASGAQGLRAGTAGRISLVGRSRLNLDRSAGQINAPAAWQAGLTGKGIRIAVLDSGYDATHPDLAGAVVGSKDFSGTGINDTVGHGTHVASTVAGRGAAYRGVARDADLLIGKVCDDYSCPDDAVLAGMEWAAESGAKVVNLSLGKPDGTVSDPLSRAVDELTARYGTLFVVSAGNSGTRARVGSPAVADAALAVASVGRTDQPSEFSSRGPGYGDEGLKPDIAAPGEDIVAARAKDGWMGEPVASGYTKMSGTSMAAPHVAGAAALLRQQHPEWSPARVKAALMGTSAQAGSPIASGAGRVDLARATTQPVMAEQGSVSFGLVTWPHPSPVTRTLTYRNDSPASVTVALAGPSGLVWRLSATDLVIPAGGSATVDITFDPAKGTGWFEGVLTATGPGVSVRTSVGGYSEEEKYALTVTLLDRAGQPDGNGIALATNLADEKTAFARADGAGQVTFRLPAGDYAVYTSAVENPARDDYNRPVSITELIRPKVGLRADTAVTLDARAGKPVTVSAPDDPGLRPSSRASNLQVRPLGGDSGPGKGRGAGLSSYTTAPTTKWYSWSAGGEDTKFGYTMATTLSSPRIRILDADIPIGYHALTGGELPGDQTLSLVPADAADVRGKLVVVTGLGASDSGLEAANRAAAGGAVAILFAGNAGYWESDRYPLPTLSVSTTDGAPLVAGAQTGQTIRTRGVGYSPVSYNLVRSIPGRIPTGDTHAPRRHELGTVEAHYRSQGTDELGRLDLTALDVPSIFTPQPIRTPAVRTEYYTPGVRWIRGYLVGRFLGAGDVEPVAGIWDTQPTVYPAGSRQTAVFGDSILGPVLAPGIYIGQPPYAVTRTGNTLDANISLFGSLRTGTGPGMPITGRVSGNSTLTLSRNGQPLQGTTARNSAASPGSSPSGPPGTGSWELPADVADYRLDLTADRDSPQITLGTRLRASWTFRSGHTAEPAPAGLLMIGYTALTLDDRNSAPAGLPVPIEIRASGARRVTASFSTDDGATWHRVPVLHTGGSWLAIAPATRAGHTSLRIEATGDNGTSATHELTRAYRTR